MVVWGSSPQGKGRGLSRATPRRRLQSRPRKYAHPSQRPCSTEFSSAKHLWVLTELQSVRHDFGSPLVWSCLWRKSERDARVCEAAHFLGDSSLQRPPRLAEGWFYRRNMCTCNVTPFYYWARGVLCTVLRGTRPLLACHPDGREHSTRLILEALPTTSFIEDSI